jgi:hypothetical protein
LGDLSELTVSLAYESSGFKRVFQERKTGQQPWYVRGDSPSLTNDRFQEMGVEVEQEWLAATSSLNEALA